MRLWIVGFSGFIALASFSGSGAQGSAPAEKPLYTNQGNGTVLDKKNDLLWQHCNFGQALKNGRCLESARRLTRKAARGYCAGLKLKAGGEQKGTKRVWRLPTIGELKSLTQAGSGRPSIDLKLFPGTSPFQYWSSTTFLDNRGTWAYIFSFEHGYRFGVNRGTFYARCVSKR